MNNKVKLANKIEEIINTLEQQENGEKFFRYNQQTTLKYLSDILRKDKKGSIIADEVGMGKTRIAIFAMIANALIGESSLVIVPPGLMHQWKKEWREVFEQIKQIFKLDGIDEPLLLHRLEDIFCTECYPILTPMKPRIVIVPHTLQLKVRQGTPIERIDLPILIRALDKANLPSGRTNTMRYTTDEYLIYDGWYCKAKIAAAKYIQKEYKKTKAFLSNGEKDLINTTDLHPYSKNSYDRYEKYVEAFKNNVSGENIYFKAFFKLLGDYSLIIIDEAHKSKSESGHEKRLGNIISHAQNAARDDVFTIGMTATPIELSPTDWIGIINRINEDQTGSKCINDFSQALRDIRRAPNVHSYQEKVLNESKSFEMFLSPVVTRRTRLGQDDFKKKLAGKKFDLKKCFPHHCRQSVVIKQEDLLKASPKWIDIAFYYEAIHNAAKGMTDSELNKAKMLDRVFARGDLNTEYLRKLIENLEKLNAPQAKRISFWASKLFDTINQISEANSLHPRIAKTIEVVEEILVDAKTGEFKEEKVLIFTTFRESASELNEIVSNRLTLRAIDIGILLPISDRQIQHLLNTYKKLPKDCFIKNLIASNDTEKVLTEHQKRYEGLRTKIRKQIDNSIFTSDDFIGEYFFQQNQDKDKGIELIREYFSFSILEHLLKNIRFSYSDTENSLTDFSKDQIKALIHQQWKQILTDYLSQEDLDDEELNFDSPTDAVNQGTDQEEVRLDRWADKMTLDDLKKIIDFAQDDEENETFKLPISKISRRIYGDTKMNSRKNIQTLFNDKNRFPKVLIAQSAVGREGLNLHKACRNLILFHQEWNPAVIEQQIGRIDRINSHWEELLNTWEEPKELPFINIYNIVFEGTYDEHQAKVLNERSENLKAQLYGGILSEENIDLVSDEFKEKLKENAPSFCPQHYFEKEN